MCNDIIPITFLIQIPPLYENAEHDTALTIDYVYRAGDTRIVFVVVNCLRLGELRRDFFFDLH